MRDLPYASARPEPQNGQKKMLIVFGSFFAIFVVIAVIATIASP